MKKKAEIEVELAQTEVDLEHFVELKSFQDLNVGHSPTRDRTMNEVQRLILEKRAVLRWVLEMPENE